jgi:hypothetical protein
MVSTTKRSSFSSLNKWYRLTQTITYPRQNNQIMESVREIDQSRLREQLERWKRYPRTVTKSRRSRIIRSKQRSTRIRCRSSPLYTTNSPSTENATPRKHHHCYTTASLPKRSCIPYQFHQCQLRCRNIHLCRRLENQLMEPQHP